MATDGAGQIYYLNLVVSGKTVAGQIYYLNLVVSGKTGAGQIYYLNLVVSGKTGAGQIYYLNLVVSSNNWGWQDLLHKSGSIWQQVGLARFTTSTW